MSYPFPELAIGNLCRIKTTGRGAIIVGHAGFSPLGEPVVLLHVWDHDGQLVMSERWPEEIPVPASNLMLVRICNCQLTEFDPFPHCSRCNGSGILSQRPCPLCQGRGRSRIMRRIHPELLDNPLGRTC
jgi:hypothetical protein